jgi:lipopolysaccharide/colanic/teichoic acid biosynthesis glycosyltransferase
MSSQLLVKGYALSEAGNACWLPLAIPRHRSYVPDNWYVTSRSEERRATLCTQSITKRAMDVLLALLGLVLLSPFMLILAIAIVVDSLGSPVYRTYRVGKNGRLFRFYKFRTMVNDADLMLDQVSDLNERDQILFKVAQDPRLTRLGRLLRRFSLDELPQFWNVLRGDMSMVGPRPPLPAEYEQFRPEHRRRMDVLPGLTGLWQVEARSDQSFETYVRLDCHYVDNWNLLLDLRILLKTIPAVLSGTGE